MERFPAVVSTIRPAIAKNETGSPDEKKTFFQRHSLKVGNQVTNAAQLTLRETLWPLFLVTILYFLWVRDLYCWSFILVFSFYLGPSIWAPRHPQQTLPEHS
jgi:hypothetical protein